MCVGVFVNVSEVITAHRQGCDFSAVCDFLFVTQISRERLNRICARFTGKTCLVLARMNFYRESYASAVLGVVILSVHLSHACFVTNPKNIPAIFLYHIKGQSF